MVELRLIEHRELTASLQLLGTFCRYITLLTQYGSGTFAALNPYQLWWAVILIAGLSGRSFCHAAHRFRKRHTWTGLLGGLASSTAATVALARYTRQHPVMVSAAISGTLAACGIMFFVWLC